MKNLLASILAIVCSWPGFACSVGPAQDSADSSWPLAIERPDSRILLYQLQPESLTGDELTARAAVSITRKQSAEPIFGAVWLDARIATDRDARTVTLLDVQVPSVRFPAATDAEREDLAQVLRTELSSQHATFSLDELVATLDPAVQAEPLATDLQNDPPRVVFARRPTALVSLDGEPQLGEVDGSQLMRVLNTPFILLFDPSSKTYFLDAGGRWRRAEAFEGPWKLDAHPPAAVTSALPPPTGDAQAGGQALADDVDVLVVTQPTELIVSQGDPRWTPLAGNDLLYLSNSENDVFLETVTRTHYALLAGRWYASASLEQGSWTFVPADQLPAAFARIPANSEKARVRTFVAGTNEAREAVLDASIPQTTAIARNDSHCSVTYDGEPRFESIPGTSLRYAVNTTSSVLEWNGRFYCCSEGVWYVADAPQGPWIVCTDVPDDVYRIPPSCPIYPVRYVYVYDWTPDFVYVGYLPGYTGCYVAGPTIVYGTGYWYHGWYGHAYYPWPWTWGFCPRYDPWLCSWGFGFSFGWGVNPWWFGHSCGWGHPGWWGPGGFHGRQFEIHGAVVQQVASPKLPSTGKPGLAFTSTGRENLYQRDANRARSAALPGVTQPAQRTAAVPNDVFADRSGRVMRRGADGWEERQQSQWKRATPQPAIPPAQGPAAGRGAPVPRTGERSQPMPPPQTRPAPQPPPSSRPAPQPQPSSRPVEPPSSRPPPQQPPASRPVPQQPPASRPAPPESRPSPQPPESRPAPPDWRPPPPEANPQPSRPPLLPPIGERLLTRPLPPMQNLRPLPFPGGDSFERMGQARDRGNARSSDFRQQGPGRRRGG